MCSMETNETVEVREGSLSDVQESGPSKEGHLALGESLRSGETNRMQEEAL
jgi:hypothetical protein